MFPSETTAETRLCYNKSKIIQTKQDEHSKSNGISKNSNGIIKGNSSIDGDTLYDVYSNDHHENGKKQSYYFGQQLIWRNIIAITIFHVIVVYAYFTFPYRQRWKTAICAWLCAIVASFGVGAGVHRLWTHRSYKAKTPLRIILLCCYYSAGMNSIYNWVRDHRIHHKFSETNADPHNSSRGFFFSHVGWLMMRKHPDVYKKGQQINMDDVTSDPVVAFGDKYFLPLKIFFCFILPTSIPVYIWNEDWYYAIMAQVFMRYAFILNATWSVNSVAHMFGWKPYDRSIAPVENILVSWSTGGEGWHNYHHVFPWDYKTSEFGHYPIDMSTIFINTFAKIGWAYDLKQPSPDLVKSIVVKKGDRSLFEVPVQFNNFELSKSL
ncbi:acyl-CoA Delta-9 desaturase-like [Phymastichus coffea]|uniref:acyl-CoA Delta-9 desaturase-like n=1 Tax=Phymastichus coffea TaxID=108790 RepID=UPI00273AC9AF|nr:acyl-CoA Delta-9 desaturase-like [Phymastichus coffea]